MSKARACEACDVNWKLGKASLRRRIEELEARTAPTAEPVIAEIAYVSPDGTEEVDCTVGMTPSPGPCWLRRLRG